MHDQPKMGPRSGHKMQNQTTFLKLLIFNRKELISVSDKGW